MSGSTAVQRLRGECDRLADAGRTVDLWWRDDDAACATPALVRLLGLSRATRTPIALAVVPAATQPSLVDRIRGEPDVSVLVHGLDHANHAPPGEKPAEFGPHRAPSDLARDATEGLRRTRRAFASVVVPVFVPPWNRIAPELVPALPGLGYRAVSAFGRTAARADLGPARIDTHLDPVDWRATRSLVEPGRLAASFRAATAPGCGPIGLLTHHLVFDEALWGFCEGLLEMAALHPALRWRAIGDLIDVEPGRPFRHSPSATARPGSLAVEAAPS